MQLLPLPMSTLFLLNGIGYLVLGAALYLPALRRYQPIVRWLLIIFAAVTVVMYFMIAGLSAKSSRHPHQSCGDRADRPAADRGPPGRIRLIEDSKTSKFVLHPGAPQTLRVYLAITSKRIASPDPKGFMWVSTQFAHTITSYLLSKC